MKSSSPRLQILFWEEIRSELTSLDIKNGVNWLTFTLFPEMDASALRYTDKNARNAVIETLKLITSTFNSTDKSCSQLFNEQFLIFVKSAFDEFTRGGKTEQGVFSSSIRLRVSYYTWIHSVLDTLITLHDDSVENVPHLNDLVSIYAKYVDSILCEKESGKKFSRMINRNARRILGKNINFSNLFLKYVANQKSESFCVSLGIFASISSISQDQKVMVLEYLYTCIISSRSRLDSYLTQFYGAFFKDVSLEEFETYILKDVDKLLLRSPEIFMPNACLLVKFAHFDTTPILFKIFEHILKQFKSVNATYGKQALELWSQLSEKSIDCNSLKTIVASTLKFISDKSTSNDSKSLALNALGSFSRSKSSDVSMALLSLISSFVLKETSEQVISYTLPTISSFLVIVPEYSNQNLFDFVITGLDSSKESIRFASVQCFIDSKGHSLWKNSLVVQNLKENIMKFQNFSLANFTIEAFLLIHAYSLVADKSISSVTALLPKDKNTLFLWSDKHTMKFAADHKHFQIITYALESFVINFNEFLNDAEIGAIASALVRFSLMPSWDAFWVVHKSIKKILGNFDICEKHRDRLGIAYVEKLEAHIIDASPNDEIRSLLQARAQSIKSCIFTFPETWSKEMMAPRIVKSIVVLGSPVFQVHRNPSHAWNLQVHKSKRLSSDIDWYLQQYQSQIVNDILKFEELGSNECRRLACFSSIQMLSELNAEIAPIFIQKSLNLISTYDFASFNEESVYIWKTPQGVMFNNVLKLEKKYDEDKTKKNYGIEKWEADLRAEIEQKKSSQSQQKLSREEQILVKQQLDHENQIRVSFQNAYENVNLAFKILENVGQGSPSNISLSFKAVIAALFKIARNVSDISSERAVASGFDLAQRIFETVKLIVIFCGTASGINLLPHSNFITSAVFRAYNFKVLPKEFESTNIDTCVSRILDLSTELTESSNLSSQCFSLIFNVVSKISDLPDTDEINNLYEKSMELIRRHVSLGFDEIMPRKEIMVFLLQTIERRINLARQAKDSLCSIVESIHETVKNEEITILISALFSNVMTLRNAALCAFEYMEITEETALEYATAIWVTMQDESEENSRLAKKLWEEGEMEIGPSYKNYLVPLLKHNVGCIRLSSAKAIVEAIKLYPQTVTDTLHYIYNEYEEEIKPPSPKYDDFGVLIPSSLALQDDWEAREGLAVAIALATPFFLSGDVFDLLNFLLSSTGSLGDKNEIVRQKMLDCGLSCIEYHGKENVDQILQLLHQCLTSVDKSRLSLDVMSESAVILLGAAAKHLDKADPRLPPVLDQLLKTLETPSENVQSTVANCLAPLIKLSPENSAEIVTQLMSLTLKGETYAKRRGGAYGLSGVIKGLGISSIKEHSIMDRLKEACASKTWKEVQGAIMAFETLSNILGKVFEPHVMQILPLLLSAFGHSATEVRSAAVEAARAISSNLSAHGVKLILPAVLSGLSDYKWRTKVGSIEFLGAMAFLAPKQLSLSLPTIVPKLTEVLTDSHLSVQKAAKEALEKFSDVIHNPEIKEKVGVLLRAMADPSNQTTTALQVLLKQRIVHAIDSASLALLVPIIERGLKERSTDTKKMAAKVLCNLASLSDSKDIAPYLPNVQPLLRDVLADPVPEAREITAQTLGRLVERLGEEHFPTLVSELVQVLKSEVSGVDRQGAAQGLSEVLYGLGKNRLEELLPEFLLNTKNPRPFIREGFLSLLVFLPGTFGDQFQPYLATTIPCILSGLSDEYEFVRDASMKAGRVIVGKFSRNAVELLLPQLEKGLFDSVWRIRLSSLQLIGDLLYRLSGISGKAVQSEHVDEDDTLGTENGKKAVVKILGAQKFQELMAAIYIGRCDVHAVVRQTAIQVWKAIVTNTPRTLKEILKCLMDLVVSGLASDETDRRQASATALGDLAQKLGEMIMLEVVPWLGEKMHDPSDHVREGACIGLAEIIEMASKQNVYNHSEVFIPAIKNGIIDSSIGVRQAAARAFDFLNETLGQRAIDDVIQPLLENFGSEEDKQSNVLEGLKEVISVKNSIFVILLPNLISFPITSTKAMALTALVEVGGSMVIRKLHQLLSALMENYSETEENKEIINAMTAIVKLIGDDSLHSLMILLHEWVKQDNSIEKRLASCVVLNCFVEVTQLNLNVYLPDWIKTLLGMFCFKLCGKQLANQAWKTLDSIFKFIKKDDLENYVPYFRKGIQQLVGEMKTRDIPLDRIDGFNLPKSAASFVPMLLQGLLCGGSEVREQSAYGLNDLITYTDAEFLKPHIIQITGPLIRIMGDKFPPALKAAIMDDLILLLQKTPLFLRPFMPQLQRTFIKTLTESAPNLRQKCAVALGFFIQNQSNSDPLIRELEKGFKEEDPSIVEAMVRSVWQILDKGMISETSAALLEKSINDLGLWHHQNEALRITSAVTFGRVLAVSPLKKSSINSLVDVLKSASNDSWMKKHGVLLAVNAFLSAYDLSQLDQHVVDSLDANLVSCVEDQKSVVAESALLCISRLLLKGKVEKKLIEALISSLRKETSEMKRLALLIIAAIFKQENHVLDMYIPQFIRDLFSCVKERNIPVKLAAEKTLVIIFDMVNRGTGFLDEELSKSDLSETEIKQIGDYSRRVLLRVVANEKQKNEKEADEWAFLLEPQKL